MTTFRYKFFVNETFDPTREYERFVHGYKPGAVLELAYSGEIEAESEAEALSNLFEMFNIAHPSDYRNRSMSVGDVVSLYPKMAREGETKYFSCDNRGWGSVASPWLTPTNPSWTHTCVYFENRYLYEKNTENFLAEVRKMNGVTI